MKIKIIGNVPKKAHQTDACYDIIATSKTDLGDGRIEYGLGLKLQPEKANSGIQFDLRPRSSIHKTGMILSNCIGTIDEGYTGECKVVFYKIIPCLPDYEVGDKIVQMQVTKPVDVEFIQVDEFNKTERGACGFGSTDDYYSTFRSF